MVALLDVQRKIFNDVIDRLQQEIKSNRDETSEKMVELVKSLEYSQAEIEDLKKKTETISREKLDYERKIVALTEENKSFKKKLEELEDRTDYLDDQRRQVNLRFSGILENEGETWQQTQNKVSKIIQQRLSISPVFDRVYRVGKPSAQRPRDIITRFSRVADRDAVFRDRKKLKGTNVYINEDFCSRTTERRREQMNTYHYARRNGKIAYFNYRTLVVKEPPTEGRIGEGEGVGGAASADIPRTPRTPHTPRTSTPTPSAATPSQLQGADGQMPRSTPPAWPKLGGGNKKSVATHSREGTNATSTGTRGGSHSQRGSYRETRQSRSFNPPK